MTEISPNLPAALRGSVERANSLMAEAAAPAAPADGQGGDAPAAPAAPSQPASAVPPAEGDSSAPPAAAPVSATPAVAPPPPPPAPSAEEQRFRSEQGRRLAAERAAEAARQEAANLRMIMAAREAAAPPHSPVPQLPASEALTEAERAEWGPDMLAVVQKAARAVAAEMLAPLTARVDALTNGVQQIGTVVQEDAKTTFLRELTTLTNDLWRSLNTNDDFLDWLDEVDPFAGVPRRDLLNDAQKTFSAQRAAHFFNSFLAQREATGQPAATPGAPAAAAPAAAAPSLTLAELAAPGKAKGAAPGAASDKPIWTPKEIAAFYADVRKGVFRGRDAEKQRLEADIIAAASENRIHNA